MGSMKYEISAREKGSHMCMYDDQQTYFHELLKFIKDVETHRFGSE